MDNQHPSPGSGKVQRSSRKRVLNDYIVWETPRTSIIYYVYKLINEEGEIYIGVTTIPSKRLWQHLKDLTIKVDSLKMYILHATTDRDEAAMLENQLILKFNCTTQTNSGYARTHTYYDSFENTLLTFNSVKEVFQKLNISSTSDYKERLKYRYIKLFPKETIESAVLRHARFKGKLFNGDVLYFISYQHAAKIIGCSINMVNLCLLKHRKTVKQWQLVKLNEDFTDESPCGKCLKIYCNETNESFYSIKEASLKLNVDSSLITKVLKNKRKQTKGYSFKYL